MERKPRKKKEMLLPSSLLEDIENDELDKEMQSNHFQENNEFQRINQRKVKNTNNQQCR